MEQGRQEDLARVRKLLLRQLRKRLGMLDAEVEAQIESLAAGRLEQLGEALLDFNSLADMAAWLQSHCQAAAISGGDASNVGFSKVGGAVGPRIVSN